MRKSSIFLVVPAVLLLGTFFGSPLIVGQSDRGKSDTNTGTGKIAGYVVDYNENPIESAKVKLKGENTGTNEFRYADEDGYFEFEDLKADTYKVKAQRKGYMKDTQTVDLGEGEEKAIGIMLEKKRIIVFAERWEKAKAGTYKPSAKLPLISADEGSWFLGDTVSNFSKCGPTPHKAEIYKENGSKFIRLTSGYSSCADNVYIGIKDFVKYNKGFSIPFNKDTYLSFEETGELFNPEEHGKTGSCIMPPCFDNVSVSLVDARENQLTYVLQRYPDAEPNMRHENYREVFLDPDAGAYERNLFDDFLTIPAFDPSDTKGHKITLIELRIDEHGWAIFDNIVFGK